MARFSAGATAAGAGSTTLPIGSIYAAAGSGFALRQIEVFLSGTDTAAAYRIARLTTRGTAGAAVDVEKHAAWSASAAATPFNTHTVGPTISAGSLGRVQTGAARGSGIVWTFGDDGLVVLAGTANGIGIVPIGTGQVAEFTFTWDE